VKPRCEKGGEKMRRKMMMVSVLLLLMLFAVAPIRPLVVNAGGSEGETADVQPEGVVFSEDFEGAFPGTAWSVGDWDWANGFDSWDDTSYRAHGGSWSGWCAEDGTQTITETIWSESFESGLPGSWDTTDRTVEFYPFTTNYGKDYWDETNYRAYSGSYSAWCAGDGTHETIIFKEDFEGLWPGYWWIGDLNPASGYDYWGLIYNYPPSGGGDWTASCAGNSDHPYGVYAYDNNMDARMFRGIVPDLSEYDFGMLYYRYWTDTEPYFDYLQVIYRVGSTWYYVDTHYGSTDYKWKVGAVSIPNAANAVGFRFYSDGSVASYGGAYVDDVMLVGCYNNDNIHKYDLDMDAVMYRDTDLSAYSSVTLSYRYWLSSEPGYDYLKVSYITDEGWFYIDPLWGNSGGWQYSSVSIPTNAVAVGFNFISDATNANYEGAYIDDVSLVGTRTAANSEKHKYDNYMDAIMSRAVDLSGYSSVSLRYWYWLNSELNVDYLRVMYQSGGTWYYVDVHSGNSGGWQYSSVSIPTTATYVGFNFLSDYSITYEGAYVDDVTLFGTPPSYSVTINAYCNTEGAFVGVPITMDGYSSGYNTSYTFTGLSGTHTFAVPSKDAMGHHFKQWSTGSTNTIIVVNSSGTYTAYYETPEFVIWTNKNSYSVGETMNVYVRVRNMGPATPVRAIIKLGLPNGGQYGPLLDMTTTLPAGFDSQTYLWNTFTIPTAPPGTYSWIAELRNPITNALIDKDTAPWTLT
jgi:hypothetical protein